MSISNAPYTPELVPDLRSAFAREQAYARALERGSPLISSIVAQLEESEWNAGERRALNAQASDTPGSRTKNLVSRAEEYNIDVRPLKTGLTLAL